MRHVEKGSLRLAAEAMTLAAAVAFCDDAPARADASVDANALSTPGDPAAENTGTG